MMSMQVRLVTLAVTACASLTASCSERPPTAQPSTQPTRVAEAITVTGARELAEGETVTLAASVRYSSGVTEPVTDGIIVDVGGHPGRLSRSARSRDGAGRRRRPHPRHP